MKTFKELGISEQILKAIEERKFENPSDIQEQTIPLVLAGKDIIGGSATGSGKTLAFGAGILQHSVPRRGIQALILTPTRELAEQVAKALAYFSKYLDLNIISVYGGVSISPQIHNLRDADIVVGIIEGEISIVRGCSGVSFMLHDKTVTIEVDVCDTACRGAGRRLSPRRDLHALAASPELAVES